MPDMTWRGPRTGSTNTTARGYGSAHIKARAKAAAKHQPTDLCVRCGKALGPMGPWLHYDHNTARTAYLGFSHATCNRKDGARRGQARQRAKLGPRINTALRW